MTWTKHGRITDNKDGTFTHHGSVSSYNVDIGFGQFAPYVRDDLAKIYKFANCEIRFVPAGIEVWRDDKKVYTGAYHLEIENTIWERSAAVASKFTVVEDTTGDLKHYLNISYEIATSDATATIHFKIGSTGTIRQSYDLKSKVKLKKQRLVFDTDIKEEAVEIKNKEGASDEGPVIAYLWPLTDVKWKFKSDESTERKLVDSPKNSTIQIAEKVWKKDVAVVISPDTTTLTAGWGAEFKNSDSACYPSDGEDWCGTGSGAPPDFRIANRFPNASLDSGWTITKVEHRVYVEGVVGSPGTFYCNRYGAGDGGEDPSGHCDGGTGDGYERCGGLNYDSMNQPGTGWTDWFDGGAQANTDLMSALDDSDTYWAIGLDCDDASGDNQRLNIAEYDEANDAELRVTYTTGGLSIPVVMQQMNQFDGGGPVI